MHIAVYGPEVRADAARLAVASEAQLIVCGHSHVSFIGRDRGLTVFNPGSIGPRRMHLPILFGCSRSPRESSRCATSTARPAWIGCCRKPTG